MFRFTVQKGPRELKRCHIPTVAGGSKKNSKRMKTVQAKETSDKETVPRHSDYNRRKMISACLSMS